MALLVTPGRMDETYIKIKGKWTYYYRAVDKHGKTLDFMLSEQRETKAARRFFKQAIDTNDMLEKVVIDKSGANLAGLLQTNASFKITKKGKLIEILQVKYLNNIMEQDHRFIKKLTRPMMGFKAFYSASATLQGIEVAHMMRKHQFSKTNSISIPTICCTRYIIVPTNTIHLNCDKLCDRTENNGGLSKTKPLSMSASCILYKFSRK